MRDTKIVRVPTKTMTRSEWLMHRKGGIGGSDAGAILGLNPYKSAFGVYADKTGISADKPGSEAMRQGRDLEEYVALRFEEETGKRVRRENNIIYNGDYPFALANIDRAVVGETAGLECKTTKCLNMKRYKNGSFPTEYYCQCVHYMMVTGFEKWYLAVLVFGTEFKIFEIERDEDEIAALAEAEREFWDEHVMKRIPPAADGAKNTDDVIAEMYKGDTAGICDLAPMKKELDALSDVKRLIKEYEKEKRRIEQEIKLYMKDSGEGTHDKYKVTWRAQTRTTYDTAAIIDNFVPPDTDLTKYKKETEYRAFKVIEGQ